MSNNFQSGVIACATLFTLLLVGCGVEPEMLARIEQASFQQSQITESFNDLRPVSAERLDDDFEFKPAFPDREDPFHINKIEVAETAQQTESSGIRVVGFAKMGRQQAILKVGDETKFVQVGDRIGDIEVISISPPRVRLKNGNFTWDASMFTHHE